MVKTESMYLLSLDPVHRALIELNALRMTDPYEIRALEGMAQHELGVMLAGFMRQEPVTIPKGTLGRTCLGCGERVYDVYGRHRKGTSEMVSIAGPECSAPTATERGVGFVHVANCPKSGLLTYKPRAVSRASSPAADPEEDEGEGGVAL